MEPNPRPAGAGTSREYVVGVDGSLASVAAARWAADRALRDGALLVVVHAYQLNTLPGIAGSVRTPAMRRLARGHAERLLRSVVEQLPAGDAVRQVLIEGVADRVLLQCSCAAQMLVLGARPRHNHPHSRFIGSTAAGCLRAAECPVVLVPGIHTEAAAVSPPAAGVVSMAVR